MNKSDIRKLLLACKGVRNVRYSGKTETFYYDCNGFPKNITAEQIYRIGSLKTEKGKVDALARFGLDLGVPFASLMSGSSGLGSASSPRSAQGAS